MRDARSTGAGDPDVSAVLPTVQVAAPLVLSDEGHQGFKGVRHGARRLAQPRWVCKCPRGRPLEGDPSPSGDCRASRQPPGESQLTSLPLRPKRVHSV